MKIEVVDVLDYYNEHGFYIVTTSEQQEAVDEGIKMGILHKAQKEWFATPMDNIYVNVYVDRQNRMPATLHKIVYGEPNFYKGEIVEINAKIGNEDVEIYGKIVNILHNGRFEVKPLGSHTVLYLDKKHIRRTFEV